jgi:PadR family transcriptional regulator, regulatory protein AphA
MALEYAILGILNWGQPYSGYDLSTELITSAGNVWYADRPQIYRALAKLEEESFVSVEADPDNARGRKLYTITPAGQEALKSWLTTDYEWSTQLRDANLLRLFFSKNISPARVRQQISDYRTRLAQASSVMAMIEEKIKEGEQHLPEDAFFWRLTLTQGVMIYRTLLEWCDHVLHELDNRYPKESEKNG